MNEFEIHTQKKRFSTAHQGTLPHPIPFYGSSAKPM